MKTYSFDNLASFEDIKNEFLSDFTNEFAGTMVQGHGNDFNKLFGVDRYFRRGSIIEAKDLLFTKYNISQIIVLNVLVSFPEDEQSTIINFIDPKNNTEPNVNLVEFNPDTNRWMPSPKQGILFQYIKAAHEIKKTFDFLTNQQYYEDHKDEIATEKAARLEAKRQREIARAEERSEQSAKKLIKDLETIGSLNIDAYTLGWLAAHIGQIYAVIPERAEQAFSRVFPNAPHRVIPHGQRTRRGDPMQFGTSLSIRLKGLKEGDFIPAELKVQWPGGHPVIYGNEFIIPLVRDYGFHFTNKDNSTQDVTEIVKNIPLDAEEDFYEGLGGEFPEISDDAE